MILHYLLGDARQQLLDLGDGAAWVEALGTGLGAVHDSVASAMVKNQELISFCHFC